MKKLFTSFFLFLVFLLPLHAQSTSFMNGNVEVSQAQSLINQLNYQRGIPLRGNVFTTGDSMRFHSIVQGVLQDSNDIGIAAGIMDARDARWSDALNNKAVSPTAKMDRNFVLGIGSNTKSITSAAILLLMEDGKLTLEDPLSKWLPSYPNVDPDITIRQCLQMTSGIFNFTDNSKFFAAISANPTKIWTPDEVLTTFVDKAVFPKGTSWQYSNTNYVLLGLIIEKASGMSYQQFVRQRIIEPLGLSSMSFYPLENPTASMAHPWADINNDGKPDDLTSIGFSLKSFFSSAGAAGAYLATPQDLARWNYALFSGKLLKPETLDEMKKEYKLNAQTGYGLGILVLHTPAGDLFGHNGSIIYQSLVYYQPDLGVSISAIVNNIHDGGSLVPTFNGLLNGYFSIITSSSNPIEERLLVPSPFHSDLYIQSKNSMAFKINILDLSSGKTIYRSPVYIKDQIHLNTSSWRDGLYILEVMEENGGTFQKKILKLSR